MNSAKRALRLKVLAERSSYIENVLTHSLIANLSSVLWQRDPMMPMQVFNSEVDDLGFDLVLSIGSDTRYIQLKQVHEEKSPSHYSIRRSFSKMPGACVVVMVHSLASIQLRRFHCFGGPPAEPMLDIDDFPVSRSPGRRSKEGEKRLRENYRNVPFKLFTKNLSQDELFDYLFPGAKNEQG